MESNDFIANEVFFFLRVLKKEAIKRGISIEDLGMKLHSKNERLISNRNTIVKLFNEWELLVIDGINVNMKLGDLQQLKPISISNVATIFIANQECKIEIQKDDRLGICDLEGNIIGTFPLPSTGIFLQEMIPKYLEFIEKKKNIMRVDFGEIEGELRQWLKDTHGIDKIGENRFLKWFIDKIDQTIIRGYGTFVISRSYTEINWFFTIHESTPDIIEEHLNEYCLYIKTKRPTSNTEINIYKDKIELIYKALAPYFQGQEAKLKQLLEGKPIEGKIAFNKSSKVLCNTFNTLYQSGKIDATVEQIKVWLCRYFKTTRRPYSLSEGTTLNRYFQEKIRCKNDILLPTLKDVITFDEP